MTIYELHRNFKMECDKLDGITSMPSFLPEEIDYFLNIAIERFIKTRYSGMNAQHSGFQQNQKRTDDLRTVVTSKDYSLTTPPSANPITEIDELGVTGYSVEYPTDYWIGLGETMFIQYPDPIDTTGVAKILKRGDVTECTIENVDSELNNSLSMYRLHNGIAKPLRLQVDNRIIFYTDGNYTIPNYTLTYILRPSKIDSYIYPAFASTNTYAVGYKVTYNGKQYVCRVANTVALASISNFDELEVAIMPDHTWDEITVLAVRIAIENISDSRYQTYTAESQVIE
jgi:hypothetical protein